MRKLLALLPIIWLWTCAGQVVAQQWTPGGQGIPIVCAYNASPPAATTGQFIYAQCDVNGNISTTSSGGGGGGAITAPLGSTTTDAASVAVTTGGTIGTGAANCGTGMQGWLACLLLATQNPVNITVNSHAQSTALETSHVAKNAAGTLFGFYCTAIAGGVGGNCIAINSTSVPSTGTISGVLDSCSFTTVAGCSINHIPMGFAAATGITILISTAASPFTYTTGTDTGFIGVDYQ